MSRSNKRTPKSESPTLGLLNLHDAFLNASLQRSAMQKCPVERDEMLFAASDRIRHERAWITFLYVLIEAWTSRDAEPLRAYIGKLAPLDDVERLLAEARASEALKRMAECRHFNCHRDRREFWDEGRYSYMPDIDLITQIHAAFSAVFLKALPAHQARLKGESGGTGKGDVAGSA